MTNRAVVLFLSSILLLSALPTISSAAEKELTIEKTTWGDISSDIFGHYPLPATAGDDNNEKGKLAIPKNWKFDVGVKYFLESHTSYEFGNPSAPFQKPLSRLEFPLNTWWLDFELRRTSPRWSIGTKAGLSVSRNTDGRMLDSDWENENSPEMKTTYSENACRAEENWRVRTDVDVNISDWLGLPPTLEIRPLFAVEFQRLSLMAHDGVQWSNGSYGDEGGSGIEGETSALAMPGDGIHFRQDYYIYQLGLRGSWDALKMGKYAKLKLNGEADWGPVLGYNEDHHLQRSGDRFTYEKTSGNALYFSLGVDVVLAKDITAGISMDYLWIRTTGYHRMSNVPLHQDATWQDGVRVWSDQTSLKAHVSYAF